MSVYRDHIPAPAKDPEAAPNPLQNAFDLIANQNQKKIPSKPRTASIWKIFLWWKRGGAKRLRLARAGRQARAIVAKDKYEAFKALWLVFNDWERSEIINRVHLLADDVMKYEVYLQIIRTCIPYGGRKRKDLK